MNGLIYDNITLNIYGRTWVEKVQKAAFLVIYTIFWPFQTLEPLNRDHTLFLIKI